MKITSTTGPAEVTSIEAAAAWIHQHRPSYVHVMDFAIDYEGDEPDADAILLCLVASIADDERVEGLRDAAGQAGDLAQVDICDRALSGDACARLTCAKVILDAKGRE